MSSIDILQQAIDVQQAKAKDYGTDRERYFPYGHVSYLTMLIIKVERLKELMGRQAVHESAMDSVVDLINYASFYGDYLQRMEGLDEQLGDGLPGPDDSDPVRGSDEDWEERFHKIDIWGQPID